MDTSIRQSFCNRCLCELLFCVWARLLITVFRQVREAAAVAAKEFPGCRRVFVFDNSAIHRARAADALHAHSLNAYKTGGAVPLMRDGWYRDSQGRRLKQSMATKGGEMKSMERLLAERGIDTSAMDKKAMAAVLAAQPDFQEQKCLVEELLESLGDGCLFLPKCHPELNAIELLWAQAKRYCRRKCKFTVKSLRRTIPKALASVSLDSVRAFFERTDAWAAAYREGKDLEQAREAVKLGAKERRKARQLAKAKHSEQEPDSEHSESSDAESDEESSDEGNGSVDHGSDGDIGDNDMQDDDNADGADKPKARDVAAKSKPEPAPRKPLPRAPRPVSPARAGVVGPAHTPCGLKNSSTQCFAICGVQLVFGVPSFLSALLQLAAQSDLLSTSSAIVQSLVKLAVASNVKRNQHRAFQLFVDRACYQPATQLSAEYGDGRENDAGEFFHHLLDHLRDSAAFARAIGSNPFDAAMHFRRGSALHCPACGHSNERFRGDDEGTFYALHLSAAQFATPSLSDALARLTALTEVSQACARCGTRGKKTKHAIFANSPHILFIQIERWDHDSKCTRELNVPQSLDVSMFSARYRFLAAAVHHGGSVRSGHWTALVSRSANWFQVSDKNVENADLAATLNSSKFKRNVAALLFERVDASDEKK